MVPTPLGKSGPGHIGPERALRRALRRATSFWTGVSKASYGMGSMVVMSTVRSAFLFKRKTKALDFERAKAYKIRNPLNYNTSFTISQRIAHPSARCAFEVYR